MAPCKFVAKVASDLRKPDGLVVVPEDEVRAFLAPLPIERMWGVGPKTAPKLKNMGLLTLGDLANAKTADLEQLMGRWGTEVRALARGEDDRIVDPHREAVSVGAEQTYEHDLKDHASIEATLLDHAGRVAQRLLHAGLLARVVVVKLKYADFRIRSRRVTLEQPVADTGTIYEAAKELLARFEGIERGVRLTGISVAGLGREAPPVLFPNEQAEKRRKLEEVIAGVSERFGGEAPLVRAALLGKRPGRF